MRMGRCGRNGGEGRCGSAVATAAQSGGMISTLPVSGGVVTFKGGSISNSKATVRQSRCFRFHDAGCGCAGGLPLRAMLGAECRPCCDFVPRVPHAPLSQRCAAQGGRVLHHVVWCMWNVALSHVALSHVALCMLHVGLSMRERRQRTSACERCSLLWATLYVSCSLCAVLDRGMAGVGIAERRYDRILRRTTGA